MLVTFSYAVFAIYVCWPNPEQWKKQAALLAADPIYYEGIPNFIFASADDWRLIVEFSYAYLQVCVSYGLTLFFNVKIYRYLKTMEDQMTSKTKDAHRQINKTLIIQALTPAIICLIPVAGSVSLTFLKTNIQGLGLVLSMMFSLIPLINPILTLIVIRNYRKTIVVTVKKLFNSSQLLSRIEHSLIHPLSYVSSA
uniref:Uncharacterized protein n=1 Tax=Panagrolaimus sp. JU765 TaxID=591449 RepID=A0AC34RLI7_9BILA